jgi:hypothetical protein
LTVGMDEVTAERLGELLGRRRPDVEVTEVSVVDESEGSASRLRLDVDYAPDRDAGLPTRLFLKRNLCSFGFPAEMYSTEVRFCRDLQPELSFEHPEVFAIDHEDGTTNFAILMEDVSLRPGARLGIVTAPVGPADVAGLLDTLARLHALFWESPRLTSDSVGSNGRTTA